MLSQDSVLELSTTIDCNQAEVDAKETTLISKAIKQCMDLSQRNWSIVSISSDEGANSSNVEQANKDESVLNSEDLFTQNCDEQQANVEIKAEQTFIVDSTENGKLTL